VSNGEFLLSRYLIEPEPTAAEFVALLSAMQPTVQIEPPTDESMESNWARASRREQLRTSLNDTGNGWNR
jgi:hypothetical protein